MLLWLTTEHISKHTHSSTDGASCWSHTCDTILMRTLSFFCGSSWLLSGALALFWKCCLGSEPPHHCQRIKKEGFFSQYLPPSGILLHPPVCVPIRSHFYLSPEPCGENPPCFSYRLKRGGFVFNSSNDEAATKRKQKKVWLQDEAAQFFLYLAPRLCWWFLLSSFLPLNWIICVKSGLRRRFSVKVWVFLGHYLAKLSNIFRFHCQQEVSF